jgi:hypothetical protein
MLREFQRRYGLGHHAWLDVRRRAIKAGLPLAKKIGRRILVDTQRFEEFVARYIDYDESVREELEPADELEPAEVSA